MKAKIMCRTLSLCCTAAVILLLTGCNQAAGAAYEVTYSSGYVRDCYTWDEESPIEGSSYYLRWEEAEDYEKTHSYDLLVLDADGSAIYEYPGIGSKTMRGIMLEDDIVWVCTEQWAAPHYNGYIESCLKESTLLLLDLSDGEILFQDKAGENEFYITSNETRCYFYAPGKEESEKLFGLVKIPSENAIIYYRDTADWTEKHTIYTFDYVLEPDIDTSNGVETRIKFYVAEDQLRVVWTSYESIGNEHWDYLEKKAYEISLTENVSE